MPQILHAAASCKPSLPGARHFSTPRLQIIRGQAPKGKLPPASEYLDAARQRLREMAGLPGDGLHPGLQST